MTQKLITVKFANRPEPVRYTAAIIDLLKTDPQVMLIIDDDTGAILFSR